MNSSVVVLTPHGRRQTVKVQPNTTILKVLEDVCTKHKFDSNEYDLKHHQRIIDLSTPFRFSGLPNNAQLEMVEAQKKRQDADVELVLQLSDGTRVDGKFKPNTTLFDIIQQLCPNENTGIDLFAIYMRTEVSSDKLNETSLKDLGLLSGRAIIRLIHRDPNAAKIQANVALNLQPKAMESNEVSDELRSDNKVRKTSDTIQSSILKTLKEEKAKIVSMGESSMQPQTSSDRETDVEMKLSEAGPSDQRMRTPEPEPEPMVDDIDEDTGEVHILGDRHAVLFILDAANSARLSDIPDSFFELGVHDIKILLKDLRTQSHGTVDQPLLTAKLREMEDEQNQLSKLNRYKSVIIRIQFPNRYVLQGTFTPYETIETVMEFVRAYLIRNDIEFHLYTTPPKNILLKNLRLFEANCVPSAILHFGSDEKLTNYLKEDILQKVSSPKASLKQALIDRGLKESVDNQNETFESSESAHSSQTQRKTNFNAFKNSTASSNDAKLPKWFKPFGK